MRLPALLCAAALGLFAAPASAVVCYVVYDRAEAVVYQSIDTPVDLSDAGVAERNALRARGQQLLIMDVERCPLIVVVTTSATMPMHADDVVSNMPARSTLRNSRVATNTGGAAVPTASGGTSPLPAGTTAGRSY